MGQGTLLFRVKFNGKLVYVECYQNETVADLKHVIGEAHGIREFDLKLQTGPDSSQFLKDADKLDGIKCGEKTVLSVVNAVMGK